VIVRSCIVFYVYFLMMIQNNNTCFLSLYVYRYPKCECPSLFTGPHCEFLDRGEVDDGRAAAPSTLAPSISTSVPHGNNNNLLGVSIFFTGLLALILLCGGRSIRGYRRKRRENILSTNLQGFRDGGTDRNGSFAVRENGTATLFRSTHTSRSGGGFVPRLELKRKDSLKQQHSSRGEGGQVVRRNMVSRSDSYSRGNGTTLHRSDSYSNHNANSNQRAGVVRSESFGRTRTMRRNNKTGSASDNNDGGRSSSGSITSSFRAGVFRSESFQRGNFHDVHIT
jgi:hypothetical protein